MDLEKQRSHKFNFFKTAPHRQSLGFSNLNNTNDYTTLIVIALWMVSGFFFRMDARHPPVQEMPKTHMAAVAMNPVDAQEKLKFISQVKLLKFSASYKENTPELLKEINKTLKLAVTDFELEDGTLLVQGYMSDTKKKVELSFEDDSISVKWINVTPGEVQLFTNAWKGETETEVRTNPDNTKQTVLVANILRMQASPIAIVPSNKIKALETQLEKLKEENFELKKNNAEMVVKQAVKDNPHLKSQEKQIQKFVDSFMQASKEK
jgi:hypothetical protein